MYAIRRTMRDVFSREEIRRWRPKSQEYNTWLYHPEPGVDRYRLHKTDVVEVNHNSRTVIFNTGGWQSATTKKRMNKYVPNLKVRQNKGRWYIHVYLSDEVTITQDFEEGVPITYDLNTIYKRAEGGAYGSEITLKLLYSRRA